MTTGTTTPTTAGPVTGTETPYSNALTSGLHEGSEEMRIPKEGVLIIDIETTGLEGIPDDRVLEIGIAELRKGRVDEVYSSTVMYPDLKEHCSGKGNVWVFSHSDLRLEDIMEKGKDVSVVTEEVGEITKGRLVTSYNVAFDFDKFLSREPWKLDCIIPFDIIRLATDRVYNLAYSDSIEDKVLQRRILDECRGNPDKWIRSEDAYRVLCADDPGRLGMRQRHRAMDDAVREGYILKALEI